MQKQITLIVAFFSAAAVILLLQRAAQENGIYMPVWRSLARASAPVTGAAADAKENITLVRRTSGAKHVVLSHAALDHCEIPAGMFQERGQNYAAFVSGSDGSNQCGFGIGAGQALYGKLIPPAFDASDDIWMSGDIYFPVGFSLPQQPLANGKPCNMGAHIWRFYSDLSSSHLSMDLNIPAGSDRLQLFVIQHAESKPVREFFVNTSFKPADAGRQGHWQFWQVHLHLGKPGKSDGYLNFYADGRLTASLKHQAFLPSTADRSWWIRFADIQSNISGGQCNGTLWPKSNGWLVNNVWVCRRACCGEENCP